MSREARKQGYVGQVVDGAKLAEIANSIYALQYGNDFKNCTVDNFLFITLKDRTDFGDNRYALVCTEGVGWEQNEYGAIAIPTNLGQMGLYNGEVVIGINVIKDCLTDKVMDISEYIRSFGSRLDSNCYTWQNLMSVPSDMIPA